MIPTYHQRLIEIANDTVNNCPTQSIFRGILAGIYISFGALLMSIGKASGCNSIVCGFLFSCGLFFVVITGANLFTGNCIVCGLAPKLLSPKRLVLSYISNLIGAIIVFFCVLNSGIDCSTLIDISVTKCNADQSLLNLFMKGFLCNVLVCMAVYFSAYLEITGSNIERFIAVVFPVTIFVACGFEHSIADMFFIPFGVFAHQVDILTGLITLVIVTIGNILGGSFIGYLFQQITRES